MPISHALKTIFIHIPKNAGESIERTLGMYGGEPLVNFWGVIDGQHVLQHLTADELRKVINNEEVWSGYFKFGVVRNPWSKAVSEYNWYLRYGANCSFRDWVSSLEVRIQINRYINERETGHNIPQWRFLFDAYGRLLVDQVLKFETINEEYASLAHDKQWPTKLLHAQTTASTSKRDFRLFYDAQSVETIERLYAEDINIFEYSKDETFGNACL